MSLQGTSRPVGFRMFGKTDGFYGHGIVDAYATLTQAFDFSK